VVAELRNYGALGSIQAIFDGLFIHVRFKGGEEREGERKTDQRCVDEGEFAVNVNNTALPVEGGEESASCKYSRT